MAKRHHASVRFTKKQQLVTELLASDYNVPEIAVHTGIPQYCIEKIVMRAKMKLGVRHSHGLVAEALRFELIQLQRLARRMRW